MPQKRKPKASEVLGFMLDSAKIHKLAPSRVHAIMLAKQALDILATLEEGLHLREPVTIEKLGMLDRVWTATRGERTHVGSDLTDALGQLCQVLAMDQEDNKKHT